jgi:hypothetical protein
MTELKAGPVDPTELGPGQGQDGVIVTALLQGVICPVPTPVPWNALQHL